MTLVEESRFEVEFVTIGTRGIQTTNNSFGYLMRDREESGIVASKWYGYGNLVGMFRL